MPPVSEKQRRAMYAAAEGKSNLGIPEKVGKEFVKSDADPVRAAGIMFVTKGEHVLFLKRGPGGDHPGEWCFPGGHSEAGESARETAERETIEEVGFLPEGERTILSRRISPPEPPLLGEGAPSVFTESPTDFTTFIQRIDEEFTPIVSGEHTGYSWALASEPPEPLHPGCRTALAMLTANELDIARMMAAGELTSPQYYRNVALVALRITGTGAAYRRGLEEYCWRDPANYLNDEFLARCNGLQVIFEHPEDATLNSSEFASRTVGAIFLPYIKADEVWGIAKIYDAPTISLVASERLSTSPTVVLKEGSQTLILDGGEKLLIEAEAALLDHVAICEQGVWDKGGAPAGVESQTVDGAMTEEEMKAKADAEAKAKADAEERAKADSEKLDQILKFQDAMCARMDAVEKKMADAEAKDETEEEKKAREDKARKDGEEKEEKEKADKAKADADELKARMDEMEGKIPRDLTDSEATEMADAQAKADAVYSAFGKSAPRNVAGETPLAYRRRLLVGMQEHSADWKTVDLTKADAAVLGIAEQRIYADAMNFARSPRSVGPGKLRARHDKTAAGHTITTYTGDIAATYAAFKLPSKAARIKRSSEIGA